MNDNILKKKSKKKVGKKNRRKVHFNNKISTYLVESPSDYWRTFDIDMFYNNKILFETECKINQLQKYQKSNIEIPQALLELKMEMNDYGYFSNFEWVKLILNIKFSSECDLYEKLKKYYWVIDEIDDINKIRKSSLSRSINVILIFKNSEKKRYESLVQLQNFIQYLRIKFEKVNSLKKLFDSINNKILIQRNGQLNQINNEYFEKLKKEQIK